MKLLNLLFCTAIALSSIQSLKAQDLVGDEYLNRNAIYDYSEIQLNNTDSIPDFESKAQKLKISGTIYLSDGVTPAKDVILYIEQTDENGEFDLRTAQEKRYVHHRGWIKTDADGHYTFYTFVPGNDRRYNQLQQLYPVIKEPSKPEYALESFLFDDDPYLSKTCRKRLAKRGLDTILKLEKQDELYVTTKNIVLPDYVPATK
jgi:protocatechuate 3,4-dioxygenase beta subunit